MRLRMTGIRVRVLAIALIPSVTLLVTGASVAGYLISEGLSQHSFAAYSAGNVSVLTRFASGVTFHAVPVKTSRLSGVSR